MSCTDKKVVGSIRHRSCYCLWDGCIQASSCPAAFAYSVSVYQYCHRWFSFWQDNSGNFYPQYYAVLYRGIFAGWSSGAAANGFFASNDGCDGIDGSFHGAAIPALAVAKDTEKTG